MARQTVEIVPPMSYSPQSIQINAGDTVQWISRDNSDVHTVSHDDLTTFRSGILNEGDTFEHTFDAAGDFPYFCEVHGKGMSGTVHVAAAAAARHTIEIVAPMSFSPASLQIHVGDTVEWISRDSSDVHTVTHNDKTTFRSGLLNEGDKFEHTFGTAGDFPYFCEVHGKAAMSGLIEVR
jgi:plastocyanin